MSKRKNKALDRLDRRVKAWQATIKSLPSGTNPAGYRKPGSMKK